MLCQHIGGGFILMFLAMAWYSSSYELLVPCVMLWVSWILNRDASTYSSCATCKTCVTNFQRKQLISCTNGCSKRSCTCFRLCLSNCDFHPAHDSLWASCSRGAAQTFLTSLMAVDSTYFDGADVMFVKVLWKIVHVGLSTYIAPQL